MRDRFGHLRGRCEEHAKECFQYVVGSLGDNCSYCGCSPIKHEPCELVDYEKSPHAIKAKATEVEKIVPVEVSSAEEKRRLFLSFCDVVVKGDLDEIKRLIAAGVDVKAFNFDKRTPLHIAAVTGRTEVVQLLLDNGANANVRDQWDRTPLDDALRFGHQNLKALLGSFDKNISTAVVASSSGVLTNNLSLTNDLFYACAKGDKEEVARLLSEGANAKGADYDKRTPLHLACSEGHIDIALLLLSHGADLDAVDRWNRTPLDDAASSGYDDIKATLEKKLPSSIRWSERRPSLETTPQSKAFLNDIGNRRIELFDSGSSSDFDTKTPIRAFTTSFVSDCAFDDTISPPTLSPPVTSPIGGSPPPARALTMNDAISRPSGASGSSILPATNKVPVSLAKTKWSSSSDGSGAIGLFSLLSNKDILESINKDPKNKLNAALVRSDSYDIYDLMKEIKSETPAAGGPCGLPFEDAAETKESRKTAPPRSGPQGLDFGDMDKPDKSNSAVQNISNLFTGRTWGHECGAFIDVLVIGADGLFFFKETAAYCTMTFQNKRWTTALVENVAGGYSWREDCTFIVDEMDQSASWDVDITVRTKDGGLIGSVTIDAKMIPPRVVLTKWMDLGKETKNRDKIPFAKIHLCIEKTINTGAGSQQISELNFAHGIPCEDLHCRLKTGDILLFDHQTRLLSYGTKIFTRSRWDHVGLVVILNDTLMLLEAIEPFGVDLFFLHSRLEYYRPNCNIGIRRLLGLPQNVKPMFNNLFSFICEVRGRPYQKNVLELLRAVSPKLGVANESMKALFCSELIAATYRKMGLLPEEIITNEYSPADFSSPRLQLLGSATLGKLKVISRREYKREKKHAKEAKDKEKEPTSPRKE